MGMRKGLAAAVLLAMAATSPGAQAQQQGQEHMPMKGAGMRGMMGQQMMGPGMMGGGGMMCPGMMGAGSMMGHGKMMNYGPMIEGHLAYIKAELAITDAETSAWTGYANAVKGRAAAMQDAHKAMMDAMTAGSALERLDARTRALQMLLDSMKALRPATEALYNTLNDEQKKKADPLLAGGGCMM